MQVCWEMVRGQRSALQSLRLVSVSKITSLGHRGASVGSGPEVHRGGVCAQRGSIGGPTGLVGLPRRVLPISHSRLCRGRSCLLSPGRCIRRLSTFPHPH